jgi:PAS domain S-box-containing protein
VHSALEHLRDVVLFIRVSDGAIRSINRAAEQMYGWRLDELERMRIYDLVEMPEDAPPPPADDNMDSLMDRADAAMYEVKDHGGDDFLTVANS